MSEKKRFRLVAYKTENHFIRGLPGENRTLHVEQIIAEMAGESAAMQGAGIVIISGSGFRKKLIDGRATGPGPYLIN